MQQVYLDSDLLSGLISTLDSFSSTPAIQSVVILAADSGFPEAADVNRILKQFKKPVAGGVFPEIIVNGNRRQSGILLLGLPFEMEATTIRIDSPIGTILNELDHRFSESDGRKKTVLLFYDSLGKQKTGFVESLYNYFGNVCSYFGGGAGSLSFKQIPCVISNDGVSHSTVVVGLLSHPVKIGVAHGWEPVSDPMKVTRVSGNVIHELNWKPAFPVYKGLVEAHSGSQFNDSNFFELAKSYPLGIARLDVEMIVRDPFATDGRSVSVLDEILEGEYVQLLHGNTQSLLAGAGAASGKSGEKVEAGSSTVVFCIDCISRVLYLQDDFEQELAQIDPTGHLIGALTLGEVANSGESFLEIYNKTVVVGHF